MTRILTFLVALSLLQATAQAQSNAYPPELEGSRSEAYKTIDGVKLRVWIFEPEGHQQTDSRPAIIFFFGGGWKSGNPRQFEQHCRTLASRGMVAMTADYRVLSRNKTLADRSVADAKSAIRWMRTNAARLGIDPNRIVAAGGSAGGHLAACTGVISDLDEPSEDSSISSVPNAMVLFNPALVLEQHENIQISAEKMQDLTARMGVAPKRLSPIHHVRSNLPPTIIFHGKADTTVPFATVEAYTKVCKANGNRCELKGYDGAAHGFFNYGRKDSKDDYYSKTMAELEAFLVSLGYLAS